MFYKGNIAARYKVIYTMWFHLYQVQDDAKFIYDGRSLKSFLEKIGWHLGVFWKAENDLFPDLGTSYTGVQFVKIKWAVHLWYV